MAEQTFEQQVAAAATSAGIEAPLDAPMTTEEEQSPADTWAAGRGEEKPEPAEKAPAVAEPAKAAEPKPEPPQTVPLAVHIRQRERLEAQVQQLRQITETGNRRLEELTRALQPAPITVDRTSDPLGSALEGMDKMVKDVGDLKEAQARQQQTEQNRAAIAHFSNAVLEDERLYTAQAPDLAEAIKYAKDMKFREYTALGAAPQEAAARVQQDAYAVAQHAFNTGQSPSELVYKMAQVLGYKKVEGAEPAASEPAAAPQKTAAEQAVEMRAAGAARGKNSGGAATSGGAISMAELAQMDNDEFAKMTSGKKWDRLWR